MASTTAVNEIRKFDWIDKLRGIAILMVVAVHVIDALPLGYKRGFVASVFEFGQLGVQLFFVASAITLCLSTKGRAHDAQALPAFFVRRYFRIAPMYYLGVVLYCLISCLRHWYVQGVFTPSPQYSAIGVFTNLVFIHGFTPASNNSLVPGGWSIGTEFAFYAVFPALFAALHWSARRLPIAAVVVGLILVCLGAEWVLSTITGVWVQNNTFLYFNLLNQLPVFLIGMLAYWILQSGRRPANALLWTLIALAAALLVLAWHSEVRLAFFAVPLVAACGFACLALWWSARTTRDDWLSEVGRRSYSIYILHFFAVQLLEPALRRSVVAGLSTDLTILVCFVIGSGLAYFMAGMTHRWIELPGIALGKRVIERLRER